MLILGLNAFHADSSAALLRDGELVAAVEEERFRRIKHWSGFPRLSIDYCLHAAHCTLADVDVVAINSDPAANRWRRYAAGFRAGPRLVLDRLKNRARRQSIEEALREMDHCWNGALEHVNHHVAHLASTFFASGYQRAACLSVDGFGDFASAAWGLGDGLSLGVDKEIHFPHSLGIFYQAMTQYLGFPRYGDEYKVMGLAPYGRAAYIEPLRNVLSPGQKGQFRLNLRYFRHHRERIAFSWQAGEPRFDRLYSPALIELLGPPRATDKPLETRHHDLAASTQALYEQAFLTLARHLKEQYGVADLCLAGGCAMNSVANGKVRRAAGFRRVYVQAAAGDAGGAIGAAATVAARQGASLPRMAHAYWGPRYEDADIEKALRSAADRLYGFGVEHHRSEAHLIRLAADAIVSGAVVGWFQGRMEWGPRALGNRSILADPRRADARDIINARIKRREMFRPFAPAILREAVAQWFAEDDDVPFMMKVFSVLPERRTQIPAVTHVDGSGRLQTVTEKHNPRFYRLIAEFAARTGVPILLNTSFNENEPIVCRPEEALDCFLRTRMDVLVLGNFLIRRPPAAHA